MYILIAFSENIFHCNVVATSTMEPSERNSGCSECTTSSWLLFPFAEETPMETDYGLRRDRSNAYVSTSYVIKKENL